MLVRSPSRESREIIKHLERVRVENVRAVWMNQDSGIIEFVEGIPANVWAFIDDQHFAAQVGEAFGQHRTGESRPNDQIIKHETSWPEPDCACSLEP